MPESRDSKSTLSTRIISGSIGSIVVSLIVTPLEVAKVRIQAAAQATSTSSSPLVPSHVVLCPRGCGTFVVFNGHVDCTLRKSDVSFFDPRTGEITASAAKPCLPTKHPSGKLGNGPTLNTWTALRRIWLQEGWNGVYAGLRPALVMAVPNTVIYFSTYEELAWRFRQVDPFVRTSSSNTYNTAGNSPTSAWIPLVAGGSARLVATLITSPFELLRTRHASVVGGSKESMTMWQELQLLIQQEGFGSLFRGLGPTLWRDVPFSAIYWLCLERFRTVWSNHWQRQSPPTSSEQAGQAFISGAVSAVIAGTCTTPFDVIKTRIQAVTNDVVKESLVEATEAPLDSLAEVCCHDGAAAYSSEAVAAATSSTTRRPPSAAAGTFAHLRYMAATEGVASLWRGNQARMLKVAPASAIMISSYEFGKRLLEESKR